MEGIGNSGCERKGIGVYLYDRVQIAKEGVSERMVRAAIRLFELMNGFYIPFVIQELLVIVDVLAAASMKHRGIGQMILKSLIGLWKKIDSVFENQLTLLSGKIFLIAIKEKNYESVQEIIEKPILNLNSSQTAATILDILLHFYYGGIVLCHLGLLSKAADTFLIVFYSLILHSK